MDRLGGRAPNVWRRPERDEQTGRLGGTAGIAHDLVEHLAAIHAIDPGRAAAGRDRRATSSAQSTAGRASTSR